MQIFRIFNFWAGHKFLIMRKIKNLIWTCYNGGSGAEPPRVEKISGNLSKSVIRIFRIFPISFFGFFCNFTKIA